jgi:hypothetical protein
VSDSGAVFVTAKQAKALYAALGEKREIERGKPWQNDIKTTFKIQRRLANFSAPLLTRLDIVLYRLVRGECSPQVAGIMRRRMTTDAAHGSALASARTSL